MNRFLALWSVLLGCLLGGCTGFVASSLYYVRTSPPQFGFLAHRVPLPHHVAQFQRQYQEFESTQIAGGRSVDDERFFESFEDRIESIATPVGLEETVLVVRRGEMHEYIARRTKATTILGCGIGALLAAVIRLFVLRSKTRRAATA